MPEGVRLLLVSGMGREIVEQTLVGYAADLAMAIGQTNRVLVVPKASQLLCHGS